MAKDILVCSLSRETTATTLAAALEHHKHQCDCNVKVSVAVTAGVISIVMKLHGDYLSIRKT